MLETLNFETMSRDNSQISDLTIGNPETGILKDVIEYLFRCQLTMLTKKEKMEFYQYFYDNSVGSLNFIVKVQNILNDKLSSRSFSNDELNILALIFQYVRRHLKDASLADPFETKNVPSITKDALSVTRKLKLQVDRR